MSEQNEKPYDPTLPPPLNTMTLAELDVYSDYYDKEFVMDEFEPLTPEMQAISERAKHKLPDPPAADKAIRIRLAPDLLRRTKAEADRRGTSRDELIADVLEKALSA